MTTPSDNVVTFTPEAMETLSKMRNRCYDVQREYGWQSEEYLGMCESLLNAILQVIRIGGRVMRDDELALISDGVLVMGTIFHPYYVKDEDGKQQRDPLLGSWSNHT